MSETERKRILAVGAHPDDIEFGCGAILLKEASLGSHIGLLVCSLGEAGSNGTPEVREQECREASSLLEASLTFLDCGGDSKIEASRANALLIAKEIRRLRPDVVLAPTDTVNQHPDHVAISNVTRDAARLARYGGLEELKAFSPHAVESLFYYAITPGAAREGGTPFLVDVSPFVSAWEALMNCHASQMKTRNYLELQVSNSRTLGLQMGVTHGQALWPNDPVVIDSLNSAPPGARLF
ncbi:PIG-L family deacetylase [Pelagicoccus albus]|uniref:PIG-L family deacetylase n=1 Tax=Pelagicoccus albus TaxID=415222 RepID=A0A7X1B2N7_9BACT|nr:PIG-L family deacetylase [Pelagicoccus albus]MBC2604531.1 PIG-L family deacetylase [Pelagicoccus albus]